MKAPRVAAILTAIEIPLCDQRSPHLLTQAVTLAAPFHPTLANTNEP